MISLLVASATWAQHVHTDSAQPGTVPLQPLAQEVRRLQDALSFLGQPLPQATQREIDNAIDSGDESGAVQKIEKALDPLVLATVDINGESRVKVERAAAAPELVQGGSRFFLIKVLNRAQVTAPLAVTSPNTGRVFVPSNGNPAPKMVLNAQDVRDRWAEISLFNKPPMEKRLSGLPVEYQILEVYSRDAGQRSADISFNVGQGTQDIGFRNDVMVVFNAVAAKPIRLHITDENGKPTMASLTIRDRWNRLYPNPSKRLAPDFFFEPQVYRADGESIDLPPGYYTITTTGGPEYVAHTKEFAVDEKGPSDLTFHLQRWIDPSKYNWYSGDHHVHAAGCSHYANPSEGVLPKDMMRQIEGEKLNVGAVLTWGPDYYYQKQFFSGHDDPLSLPSERMHYDLEVSGFPSSHSGHLVLLGLKEQDYPGTKKIEDWPTWDMPILKWGKKQGAVVGFAHSGWGLQVSDANIPSYEMPGFDGIGANEYIVDVTEPNLVDFISAGDTPSVWELSIWYHTLNVGFRTRISGETDFPCITDDRVGRARSYVKVNGQLSYEDWIKGVNAGQSYVSDGRVHLMDFQAGDVAVGTHNSEIDLSSGKTVHVTARIAGMLDSIPHPDIQKAPYNQQPYWNLERARIGEGREFPVELVVNGKVFASKPVVADGQVHDIAFDVPIEQSSWIALRTLPAAHTNPIFVMVGGKPIRSSRASAEWCLHAVHQCWTQKSPRISLQEIGAAKQAYDHAAQVYEQLIRESGASK
jgi:hypothetical protein